MLRKINGVLYYTNRLLDKSDLFDLDLTEREYSTIMKWVRAKREVVIQLTDDYGAIYNLRLAMTDPDANFVYVSPYVTSAVFIDMIYAIVTGNKYAGYRLAVNFKRTKIG